MPFNNEFFSKFSKGYSLKTVKIFRVVVRLHFHHKLQTQTQINKKLRRKIAQQWTTLDGNKDKMSLDNVKKHFAKETGRRTQKQDKWIDA